MTVPSGPDWLHEVKYDGYRLRLERDGDRVRLITRGGYNWTGRYPWIVEAARRVRQKHFVLDGEAVVLGVDGISDFNALHSRKHDHEVQFCAFDILAKGGDDLRMLPLSLRKTNLERLLARRSEGVFINPFERGELGPDLFRAACNMDLEGLVSKRRDRPGRPLQALDQGQEPAASGDGTGAVNQSKAIACPDRRQSATGTPYLRPRELIGCSGRRLRP